MPHIANVIAKATSRFHFLRLRLQQFKRRLSGLHPKRNQRKNKANQTFHDDNYITLALQPTDTASVYVPGLSSCTLPPGFLMSVVFIG
jgi:hypothetical protein